MPVLAKTEDARLGYPLLRVGAELRPKVSALLRPLGLMLPEFVCMRIFSIGVPSRRATPMPRRILARLTAAEQREFKQMRRQAPRIRLTISPGPGCGPRLGLFKFVGQFQQPCFLPDVGGENHAHRHAIRGFGQR